MTCAAADLQVGDRVLEVGPGRGALTERLLDSEVEVIHAIEVDRDLVVGLRQQFEKQSRLSIHEGDILSVSLKDLVEDSLTKVVANIPYNITGPLLQRLLGDLGRPPENRYKLLILLLQKEVANRILAVPNEKNYSALSVRIQLLANCKSVCDVPARCFNPQPKVESKVIAIEPLDLSECLAPSLAKRVDSLVRRAFLFRRKMLRNSLSGSFPLAELEIVAKVAGINLSQRPQELSPQQWLEMARLINSIEETGAIHA